MAMDMSSMIDPLKAQWSLYAEQLEQLDEQLNFESAGRTKVLNDLVTNYKSDVDRVLPQVETYIASLSGEARVAVIHALSKALRAKDLQAEVDSHVESQKTDPNVTPPSDAEIAAMRKQFNDLVETANLIRQLIGRHNEESAASLKTFDKKRGGAPTGERGPRLHGKLNFHVDGVHVGTSLTDVSKKTGVKVHTEGGVMDAIKAAVPDFDPKSPPDSFAFTVGNHKVEATTESVHKAEAHEAHDVYDEDVPEDPFS